MGSAALHGIADPTTMADLEAGPATVVYDGACPFCTTYSKLVRLRESVGPVRLLDARELAPPLLDALKARHNLDDGMLFIHAGRIHHGKDAVHHIALLGSDSTLLRRLSAAALGQAWVAAALYPLLRLGRNTAIRLRGAGNIHE